MKYPTMLYRHPGRQKIDREMFDTKTVDAANATDLDEAVADGWFPSPKEALDGSIDDGSAPTSAELKAKAKELGIDFALNISDGKLLARINEALED